MSKIYIQMEQDEGDKVRTTLDTCGNPKMDYRHFAILTCDLVRHIAKAFQVEENLVWHWVERERQKPTTSVTGHQLFEV